MLNYIITDYPKLEGTHNSNSWLHIGLPKTQTTFPRALSKRFLNSSRLCASSLPWPLPWGARSSSQLPSPLGEEPFLNIQPEHTLTQPHSISSGPIAVTRKKRSASAPPFLLIRKLQATAMSPLSHLFSSLNIPTDFSYVFSSRTFTIFVAHLWYSLIFLYPFILWCPKLHAELRIGHTRIE